jgi:hypothetical protein
MLRPTRLARRPRAPDPWAVRPYSEIRVRLGRGTDVNVPLFELITWVSTVDGQLPMGRIYWCLCLLVAPFARSVFGDPAHAAAPARSAVFVVVWVVAFLVYATIMYLRPLANRGIDYVVLTGLLLTIAFEIAWPVSALHNAHAGILVGPLAGATLGSLWGEHRRSRRRLAEEAESVR